MEIVKIKEETADMMKLPFIKDIDEGKKKERSFWCVEPATGDWVTDCNTGREYALQFFEHIKKFPRGDTLITQIVLDMPKKQDRTGIEVGFLYVIGRAIGLSAFWVSDVVAKEEEEIRTRFKKKPKKNRIKMNEATGPLKLVK